MNDKNNIVIGAIDVGAPKNIGWAIIQGNDEKHGEDLDEFITQFVMQSKNTPSAIGFECPLFVPYRDELQIITKARNGEGNRAWSAGAGATVTTIGLAVVSYTLQKLKMEWGKSFPKTMLDWNAWQAISQSNPMLVWEAFVSGGNHTATNEHWRDALHATRGFHKAFDDLDSANAIKETPVFSTAGAAILRSGLSTDISLIKQPCLVIKP